MDFLLRQAIVRDFNKLIEFYRKEHSDALPAPSARAIGDAIERDQLLLIEGNGAIVATAGTFHMSPFNAVHSVAELAGTRVTRPVGGTKPIRMQCILVVLRMILHAAGRYEALEPGAQDTLLSLIRKTNKTSADNVKSCGFIPLPDPRPAWLEYDEISWNGKLVTDEWDYFYATDDTVRTCANRFFGHGMNKGVIALQQGSAAQPINLRIDLPGLAYQLDDLRAVARGDHRISLGLPPADLYRKADIVSRDRSICRSRR
jgi:hypothetical protein